MTKDELFAMKEKGREKNGYKKTQPFSRLGCVPRAGIEPAQG